MGIALVHVDYRGKDILLPDLLLEKIQRPLKIPLHPFRRQGSQILRAGGDNGVNELHAVLAHLAPGILPLCCLYPGLDFPIIAPGRLHQMVVEMGPLPVDVRIAGILLLLSLMVALQSRSRPAFPLFKPHDCIWHRHLLLFSPVLPAVCPCVAGNLPVGEITPAPFCRSCARSKSHQKRLPSKQVLPYLLLQVSRWNPYLFPVHLLYFLQQLQHGAGINRPGQRLTVRFLFQA